MNESRPTSGAPAPGSSASPDASQRVGTILGDRLCTRCHHPLKGQPIMREPHYSLLVARCAECGEIAPTQEYPSLARWARWWGMLLAATWLLVLFVSFCGAAGILAGFAWGITWECYQALRWGDGKLASGAVDWIEIITGDVMFLILPMLLTMFGIGLFLGVALLAARPWHKRIVLVGVLLLATAFCLMAVADHGGLGSRSNQPVLGWTIVVVLPGALLAGILPVAIGMTAGPPIARWATWALLPPALLPAMHWLWTASGKHPPTPASRAHS